MEAAVPSRGAQQPSTDRRKKRERSHATRDVIRGCRGALAMTRECMGLARCGEMYMLTLSMSHVSDRGEEVKSKSRRQKHDRRQDSGGESLPPSFRSGQEHHPSQQPSCVPTPLAASCSRVREWRLHHEAVRPVIHTLEAFLARWLKMAGGKHLF